MCFFMGDIVIFLDWKQDFSGSQSLLGLSLFIGPVRPYDRSLVPGSLFLDGEVDRVQTSQVESPLRNLLWPSLPLHFWPSNCQAQGQPGG